MRKVLILLSFNLLWSMNLYAGPSIMPVVLIKHSNKLGCYQIEDFYERVSKLDPVYLYGYIKDIADPHGEHSAIFWCKNDDKREKYHLVVWLDEKKIPKNNFTCPRRISWKNYPGGLTIRKYDTKISLDEFWYKDNPRKRGPDDKYLEGAVIHSEYDGVVAEFYCYNGKWLARQLH